MDEIRGKKQESNGRGGSKEWTKKGKEIGEQRERRQ